MKWEHTKKSDLNIFFLGFMSLIMFGLFSTAFWLQLFIMLVIFKALDVLLDLGINLYTYFKRDSNESK